MGHGAHVLILLYPMQGHVNPTIQFAKCLIQIGAKVTIATTVSGQRLIGQTAGTSVDGLNITAISDGYDDGMKCCKSANDLRRYASNFRSKNSENLTNIIVSSADEGCPVTCLVYGLLQFWAIEVARSYDIPFALFWINQAAILDIYRNYFNGFKDVIKNITNDPSSFLELSGLPRLTSCDLPSFMLPKSPPIFSAVLPSMKEQILALDTDTDPTILVNTFDELELESLKVMKKYKMVCIGPLIPSTFLNQKDQKRTDYFDWLNSKPKSSVVYIAFGSMLKLPKEQVEEIAYGLLESKRPFLWVILEEGEEKNKAEKYTISCIEELREKGMIVPWCSQLEVLSNSSLGCFVSHCGWNSTLESLVMGVPMVAFPHWADQPTNAKMIEDVWKTGVRVREGVKMINGKGIVDREEVKRCIEMVMCEGDWKKNAMKWKDLARAAVMDGGTSELSLKAFVKEVGGAS